MTPVVHHVMVNLDGGWSVTAGGRVRARKRFRTEPEAFAYARDLGHGVIYVHRPDGSVREKVNI